MKNHFGFQKNTIKINEPWRNKRGFTLIELLTVVAIIGVLAAIILPVASSVRQQARSAQCVSNLRQIALAAYLYANDHQEYPGWRAGTDRKELLFPYLHTGRSNLDTFGDQIWHCPSNFQVEAEVSYGFNTNLNWIHPDTIRNPASIVAIADAGINDAGDSILSTHLMPPLHPSGANVGRPNPRHSANGSGAANVAFVDGHVRTLNLTAPFYPGNGERAGDPDEMWDPR